MPRLPAAPELPIDTIVDWCRKQVHFPPILEVGPQTVMNWMMAMNSGQTVNRLDKKVGQVLKILQRKSKVTRAQCEKHIQDHGQNLDEPVVSSAFRPGAPTVARRSEQQKEMDKWAVNKAAKKEARRQQNAAAVAKAKARSKARSKAKSKVQTGPEDDEVPATKAARKAAKEAAEEKAARKAARTAVKEQKAVEKAARKAPRQERRERKQRKAVDDAALKGIKAAFNTLVGNIYMAGEKSEEDAEEFSQWEGFSDNDGEAIDVQLSLPFPLKVVTPVPPANNRA